MSEAVKSWATSDLFFEDAFEGVRFRWDHQGKKVFQRTFAGALGEVEVPFANRLFRETVLTGVEIDRAVYGLQKVKSDEAYLAELSLGNRPESECALLLNARNFALKAHGDQLYGKMFPYFVHLEGVQRELRDGGFKEAHLFVAAWLHDVVEDTPITLEEIGRVFGPKVLEIVGRLTDQAGVTRKEKKERTYPFIKGHLDSMIVKLCDRIANVRMAKINNPTKLALYRAEQHNFRYGIHVPGRIEELWAKLEAELL